MTMRYRSMRTRMTAAFGCFVAVLMLAGGATVMHREQRRAEKRVREILSVAVVRARVEMDEGKREGETLLDVARTDASEIAAGGLVLLVVDSGRVLWQSQKHAPPWPAAGDEWRIRTMPEAGQILVLAQDWRPIAEDLRETERALWQLGFLIVGATTIAAWFVVGITLSPLDKLAAQAQNASIDGLQVRLESPSSDAEMQHLTRTLNSLLQRLEKEVQARGRFYAAASHELRTPLQVLQGQIDVARVRRRSVESHEEILLQLQQETERLVTLVQDLLELNALEMRQNHAAVERINLTFWIQRALEQQAQNIEKRGLFVDASLDAELDDDQANELEANEIEANEIETKPIEVDAPPAHVEILLRNLLENAVKYASAGSTLRINILRASDTTSDTVSVEIWNAYAGPEHAQIENWFEPFFRPDASRNSRTGGNGLGLSIVAALVRINKWDIKLEAADGGIRALVSLPQAGASSG